MNGVLPALDSCADDRRRILLVDDDESVLYSIYKLLEDGGYEVLAARNGCDGLTIFHRSLRPVDLLVTDCQMPGMTGLELARSGARRNRALAVLFLSGSAPDEDLQEELEARGRAFLAKPFRGDDLLRTARDLLAPGSRLEPLAGPPRLLPSIQYAR